MYDKALKALEDKRADLDNDTLEQLDALADELQSEIDFAQTQLDDIEDLLLNQKRGKTND